MHQLTKQLLTVYDEFHNEICSTNHLYKKIAYPILQNWDKILFVYDNFADDESRYIYGRAIIHRIMECLLPEGRVYSAYPIIEQSVWNSYEEQANKLDKLDGDTSFDRIETWILKGYDHPECHVETGDIVFDIGAFTGNTSAYFSKQAGGLRYRTNQTNTGVIYAFEPQKDSYMMLKKNMLQYSNVIPMNVGCAAYDGVAYISERSSTGAHITEYSNMQINVNKVDTIVSKLGLDRLDFIKIDIEGLEPEVLNGGYASIQRFRPKLAIAIYHYSEHLFSIFDKIINFKVNYKFYCKHSSWNRYEVTLFCKPAEDNCILYNKYSNDEISIIKMIGKILLAKTTQNQNNITHNKDLSTRQCLIQITKNIHCYRQLKYLYNLFRPK